MRSFRGLANYYRRFISYYSAKAAPLTELLKKNKLWVWSEKGQRTFESLKAAMTEEPVLALPDLSKTFEVHTDASYFTIGGVLMQDRHPIAFESHKLNEIEQRYIVQEKEMTAFGRSNVVADLLRGKADLATITNAHCDIQDSIKDRMQHNMEAKKLMELAYQGNTRRFWVEDVFFLTVGRSVDVPKFDSIRRQIIKESHDTLWVGHSGKRSTRDKVEQRQSGGLLELLLVAECPWDSVTMDFMTSLLKSDRYGTIMVVVDRISKYATFMPATVGSTAKEVAQLFFKNVVKYWGLSRHIISDRDPRFTGNFWRELFDILGTELHFSTSFHPQTDGQTEQVNALLECYLRHYVSVYQKYYARLLDMAQFSSNLQWSESTGRTPSELETGQQPQSPHFLLVAFHGKSLGTYHLSKGWEQQLDTAKSYLDKAA
ncbi:uncharacterized protein LOC125873753 [Solanum stenotomum]|uniref:uncharacterized protein LOC125873753 n=1 Tax=Solanum stenotomum TaxID=172797 RepID=UPI0020D120FC|nr:uncharacterized protein LOC125873753 [Solanum stenotomum]